MRNKRHFRWVRADSGGNIFSRNTVARPVGPSSQGETIFSQNTGGPSGGSLLSGGGIIIFRVIRRHFLAAAVDPAVNPLHVQSTSDGSRSLTALTTPRREHQGDGRRRGLGRGRRGAGEDAAVEACAERSTRVHWLDCGVRLPSLHDLASGGNSRGGEASAAAQPATGGWSTRHDRR